jgi:hypothetical protein
MKKRIAKIEEGLFPVIYEELSYQFSDFSDEDLETIIADDPAQAQEIEALMLKLKPTPNLDVCSKATWYAFLKYYNLPDGRVNAN